jgi:hypothetical protein
MKTGTRVRVSGQKHYQENSELCDGAEGTVIAVVTGSLVLVAIDNFRTPERYPGWPYHIDELVIIHE